MSPFKIVFALLVLCCGYATEAYADDTDAHVPELIKSNLARSDLQARDCFQVYQLKGDRYVCGYLRVPENYSAKNSRIISVPFLVIMPDKANVDSALEPLLVTGGGGPGNAMLGTHPYGIVEDEFWTYEELSVAGGRALMILENRGVGSSLPDLDCHYQPSVFQKDFWPEILKTDLSCGRKFRSEGIELSQYNARNAAMDIEIFRTLYASRGVNTKSLNLYGISYGTRVAMYYERLFPHTTRAMVLDSVSMNDRDSLSDELDYAQRSLDLVFLKCRSDKLCRERFGAGLENEFYEFLKVVESRKISLVVSWPNSLLPVSVPLTGSFIVNVLHDALYSSHSIATIPIIVRSMINGSYDRLTTGLREHVYTYSSRYAFSNTAFLTYLCFDENYSRHSERDLSGLKLVDYWHLDESRKYMRSICSDYGIAAEAVGQFETTISDTPTLFLSGELDPVTPPSGARRAAAKTSYHWNIVRANVAHDVITHSSCARFLASWFIYHPQEDLDIKAEECTTADNPVYFILD